MKKTLMLIESPNKIKTIEKYLKGTNIKVLATIGHIRELDEKYYGGLGFNKDTYEIKWKNDSIKRINKKNVDIIDIINKEAESCDEIYLSTDPDREGEAISWHIYWILNSECRSKCKRIEFNEITKEAIKKALEQPRDLDNNKINSYLARKLLDRALGFKLSEFSRRAAGGLSAGRVQSIALKFLRDKERELENFVPEHWFNFEVYLENGLELKLKKLDSKLTFNLHKELKNGLVNFLDLEEAKEFQKNLSPLYKLLSIDDPKQERGRPPKALKTSTMQSKAISKFGFSSSSVSIMAQKLYEGVEIDGEPIALITYPRTDRDDLSDTFVRSAKDFILGKFGQKYWHGPRKDSGKQKNKEKNNLVQGAHEAIRPTFLEITPDTLEGKLDKNELKLYSLIWVYAVSSLMSDSEYENVKYVFDNKENKFETNFKKEIFDGFKVLHRKHLNLENFEEVSVPKDLKLGEAYKVKETKIKRVDKSPPALYNEASLVSALEDKGIGRPSTYTSIMKIVVDREYALKESGKLKITDLGLKTSDMLEKYFSRIIQYDYTRNMEVELDKISEGVSDWKQFLTKFFDDFYKQLDFAIKEAWGVCEECGSDLSIKFSPKSRRNFVGCSKFPDCRYIKKDVLDKKEKPEIFDGECPECSSSLVKRKNRWGNFFVSCSSYPNCKYLKNLNSENKFEDLNRECPQCGKKLLKKMNKWKKPFISCSGYPDCKFIESIEEKIYLDEKCPECSKLLFKTTGKWNKPYIKCENVDCKYTRYIKSEKNNDK